MKIGVLALQGAFAEHEKVAPNASNCVRPAILPSLTMHLYYRAARVPFRESF